MSGTFGNNWLDLSSTSNRYIRTYVQGFLDVSYGNIYVRTGNLYVLSGDTSLNGNLTVGNDSSFNGNLTINGNLNTNAGIILNNNLNLNNYVIQNGTTRNMPMNQVYTMQDISNVVNISNKYNTNLTVANNTFTIGNSSTINNFVMNGNTLSVNGRLTSYYDASINNRTYIAGDAYVNGRLFVANDLSVNSNLTLGNNLLTRNMFIRYDTSLSTLYSNCDSSFNSKLFVANDSSMNGNVYVGNNLIINGNLSVNQYAARSSIYSINYTFVANQDLSLNGRLFSISDISVNGRLFIGADSSFNGNLFVPYKTIINGDLSLNTRLLFNTDLSVSNWMSVVADSSMNSRLIIGRDASLNGNLYVSGNTYFGLSGTLFNIDISGTSNIRGPVVSGITLPDNSQLMTSVPPLDFSNNFGTIWTNNRNLENYNNGMAIAISATGQYQTAAVGGPNTTDYLYISNNYGINWTKYTAIAASQWVSVTMSTTGQYQTAVAINGYIYTSNNYGSTWINTNTATSPGIKNWYSVTMSSNGQFQSAVVNNEFIYTSNNYGVTWTINASILNTILWSSITMSATGQFQTAVVNGGSIYISTNYGTTWSVVNNTALLNWVSVSCSSTGQYQTALVNGGSIYTSNNFGSSWVINTSAPSSTNYTSVTVSSNGKNQVVSSIGGTNPGIFISVNYGNTWVKTSTISYINGIAMSANSQFITAISSNTNNNSGVIIYNSVTPYINFFTSGTLSAIGDGSLNTRLFVGGDGSLNTRLFVGSDILLNGRLLSSNFSVCQIFNQSVPSGSSTNATSLGSAPVFWSSTTNVTFSGGNCLILFKAANFNTNIHWNLYTIQYTTDNVNWTSITTYLTGGLGYTPLIGATFGLITTAGSCHTYVPYITSWTFGKITVIGWRILCWTDADTFYANADDHVDLVILQCPV